MLQDKGYTINQIRELTDNSEKVVKEHLDLFNKYKDEGKDRIQQLLQPSKIALHESIKKKGLNL
jgi:DNA-binding transcriptional MerR regulator